MALNTFVSLFSGAGGLDIGLAKAGWDCRYASDIDPEAVDTLKINQGRVVDGHRVFANTYLERADVRQLTGAVILAKAGLRRGDVSLLGGGPPCQSWSSAGHQQGFQDPRGRLFSDFIRLAGELEVRWLMFENVRGLLTARGPAGIPGSALELIRLRLLSVGFQTAVSLINAADYGVPQRRVRLIVIGYRAGDIPAFPKATHGKEGELALSGQKPWISLRDSLRNVWPLLNNEIIRPSGKMSHDLAAIPPGSGVKSQGKIESTRPGGHWGYKQGAFVADLNLPARTVTASAQQDWVRDPKLGLRRLCPRECAAIQTFPREWTFTGNSLTQYRLIGNAVPPTMAEAVGKTLLGHIRKKGGQAIQDNLRDLLPLTPNLTAAIRYTAKEEARNGESRKSAPLKRAARVRHAETVAV